MSFIDARTKHEAPLISHSLTAETSIPMRNSPPPRDIKRATTHDSPLGHTPMASRAPRSLLSWNALNPYGADDDGTYDGAYRPMEDDIPAADLACDFDDDSLDGKWLAKTRGFFCAYMRVCTSVQAGCRHVTYIAEKVAEAKRGCCSNATPAGHRRGTSSIPQVIVNFITTVVGAGIVGLPYVFRIAGFYMALVLMASGAKYPDQKPHRVVR